MQKVTFPTTIRVGAGSATIECPDLGYIAIMKTQAEAIEQLVTLVRVDPAFADVPEDKRRAHFDQNTGELSLEYSDEIMAAIFSKVRTLKGITMPTIAERMGVSAAGAVAKYFNVRKPVSPTVSTLIRLLDALRVSVKIGY